MKQLYNFIIEKLKISSKSGINTYNYFPKDKEELKTIIIDLLKERGKDADLNDIDTSKITSMKSLFSDIYCELDIDFEKIHIEDWNVSNVEDMSSMFHSCEDFDCDLGNWDISSVKNMDGMFTHCKKFIGKGLENWDVSNCERLSDMFFGCKSFTGKEIENWKVDNVNNFSAMFVSCENFNADLSNWNVENAIYLNRMFDHCSIFTGECVENWNTKNCVWMNEMFRDCPKFNANLGNWDISKCQSFQYMFFRSNSFEGNGLESWNSKFKNNLSPSDFKSMFKECTNLKFNPNKSWKGKRITSQMFK